MSVAFTLFVAMAQVSQSAPHRGPGIYGKLDQPLTLSLAASGGLAAGGSLPAMPMVTGDVGLFALGSAGLIVGYEYGASDVGGGVAFRRHAVRAALDVRPLFFLLFITDRFTGFEYLDLVLYSIGFEIGGSFERTSFGSPAASVADNGGGFHLGTGIDFPLGSRGGAGFVLRLSLRARFPSDGILAPAAAASLFAGSQLNHLEVLLGLRYDFSLVSRARNQD